MERYESRENPRIELYSFDNTNEILQYLRDQDIRPVRDLVGTLRARFASVFFECRQDCSVINRANSGIKDYTEIGLYAMFMDSLPRDAFLKELRPAIIIGSTKFLLPYSYETLEILVTDHFIPDPNNYLSLTFEPVRESQVKELGHVSIGNPINLRTTTAEVFANKFRKQK